MLGRWLKRHERYDAEFDCGVRVRSGVLAHESDRWRHRRSAVDPLRVDGVVLLNHGTQSTLRLRLDDAEPGTGARPRHVAVGALEVDTGARVELSFDAADLYRFGR